jgi:mutator protein MutT
VAAGLILREGRYLITKRPRGSFMEGYWEFPGGKREQGETIEECLRRELAEELGVEVEVGGTFLDSCYRYPTREIRLTTLSSAIVSGEPEPIGCEEVRWVLPNELAKYPLCPPDIEVADKILMNRKERISMIYRRDERQGGYFEPAAGIGIKTMVYGEKTHMCEFRLRKGSMLPDHSHPHEQTGLVVSGRIIINIDGKDFDAGPGDAWCIAGGVKHRAEIIEDSIVVEVFSPVREDYIKQMSPERK